MLQTCCVGGHCPADPLWVKLPLSDNTTSDLNLKLELQEFMVDSMIVRYSKQAQIISSSPPCLTARMRHLCWYSFSSHVHNGQTWSDQSSALFHSIQSPEDHQSVGFQQSQTLNFDVAWILWKSQPLRLRASQTIDYFKSFFQNPFFNWLST